MDGKFGVCREFMRLKAQEQQCQRGCWAKTECIELCHSAIYYIGKKAICNSFFRNSGKSFSINHTISAFSTTKIHFYLVVIALSIFRFFPCNNRLEQV